ncbi:MAG: lipase family protein [Verrucomicrobiota bacterium]
MKRLETWSKERKAELRARIAEWDGVFGLDPEKAFFAGSDSMPEFSFSGGSFQADSAWWLGELCRLAYTPDRREEKRDKAGKLPRRTPILAERTPFVEELSIHKTGNHVSIYRREDGDGGTILCFRGTNKTRQWIMNAVIRPHGWKRFLRADESEDAFVHSGFYVFFKRVWPKIWPVLETLPRPWVFTGHSLGGALATIAGVIARPEVVCTFGAPKVGNAEFYQLLLPESNWRVVNESDLVPRLPFPDARLRERELVQGVESIRLSEETSPGSFLTFEEEAEPPFDWRQLAKEFESPPAWIREHRMSEYQRRLRQIHDFQSEK